MPSAGALIWIACRPLLKMLLCTASGIALAKVDILSAQAARGAGQVILNITLPALFFSKVVPSFTSENVNALGPLVLISVFYQLFGLLLALAIKQVFWVPHRFRNGIVVAGIWGNIGDVPTAVVMSIMAAAPFSGKKDINLGVAYISVVILVFFITLFPMGGHSLIAKDFEGPELEDEEVKEALRVKHAKWRSLVLFRRRKGTLIKGKGPVEDPENGMQEKELANGEKSDVVLDEKEKTEVMETITTTVPVDQVSNSLHSRLHLGHAHHRHPHHSLPLHAPVAEKHVSFSQGPATPHVRSPATSTYEGVTGHGVSMTVGSPAPTTLVAPTEYDPKPVTTAVIGDTQDNTKSDKPASSSSSSAPSKLPPWLQKVVKVLQTLTTPATLSLLISFPIALTTPLKALFVPLPSSHLAPDGAPPLAFILDTADFLGAASVPLGLICLGAALARLKIPKQVRDLPIGAIGSMALGRLVIMPILGVGIVEGLCVRYGLIDREDKVLRFVAIFLSCMPTATTQVFLTQVYSGTGEAEHLSAFLIPQYAIMFVSTTALTAFALQSIF